MNASGSVLTQRTILQFAGGLTAFDSTGKTVVRYDTPGLPQVLGVNNTTSGHDVHITSGDIITGDIAGDVPIIAATVPTGVVGGNVRIDGADSTTGDGGGRITVGGAIPTQGEFSHPKGGSISIIAGGGAQPNADSGDILIQAPAAETGGVAGVIDIIAGLDLILQAGRNVNIDNFIGGVGTGPVFSDGLGNLFKVPAPFSSPRFLTSEAFATGVGTSAVPIMQLASVPANNIIAISATVEAVGTGPNGPQAVIRLQGEYQTISGSNPTGVITQAARMSGTPALNMQATSFTATLVATGTSVYIYGAGHTGWVDWRTFAQVEFSRG
ncbi:MAG TPA: hypothetical protein VIE65_02875 [Methylobacter sp.]|jgi:hypothetical protein